MMKDPSAGGEDQPNRPLGILLGGLLAFGLLFVPCRVDELEAGGRSRVSRAAGSLAMAHLTPFAHDPTEQRWRNMAGDPYSDTFRGSFRYADAEVVFEYFPEGGTLYGHIEASGLKPHFAYQVKIRGDYDASPEAHRRIGALGRWRLPGVGTNFSDTTVENHDDPREVESYLLFDYIVTDAEGRASRSVRLDSSLHVLWNDAVNYGSGPDRAPFLRHYLLDARGATAYAVPVERRFINIWAENEGAWRDRPPFGEASLPGGEYRCSLVLTEESFHDYYSDDGGHWATVLGAPIVFTVTGEY